MTNVVKHKSVICIEWTFVTQDPAFKFVSETFWLQGQKCHLEFTLGSYCSGASYNSSYLYFKSGGQLTSPTITTLRGSADIQALTVRGYTSAGTNIWSTSDTKKLRNVVLTFEVIIFISKGDKSVQISPETVEKSVQVVSYKDAFFSLESLSRDFSQLLDEGPNHDMEFIIGDHAIKAHKSIICSRSDIFTSMLQSNMLEGKTGQVEIKDMDATIFKQFLKCLYTGMLPELAVESAFQLYEAFDKYGIEALKKQCADFLTDNLTHENSCDILAFSDQHSDEDFKKIVIEYIIKENVPYMGQKWKDFCTENPRLSNEVYRLFCEKFRPK